MPYLSGMLNDQEHAIIVSTLKQVIGGGISGHSQPHRHSSSVACGTKKVEISISNGDLCQECSVDGCLGCDFFPQGEQEDKEKDKRKKKIKKSKYMECGRGHGANGRWRFRTPIERLEFGSGLSRRLRTRLGLMTKQPSSFAETKRS